MTSERDTEATGAEGRLDWLRTSMVTEPSGAADAAWAWIADLSERSDTDADGADAELNQLFRLGTPPTDLDGPTEGILVMTTTNPALDMAVRAVTALWMPWQGKRFDPGGGPGGNPLTRSTGRGSNLVRPRESLPAAATGEPAA